MIRVRQIKISIDSNTGELKKIAASKLKIRENDIISLKINKQSIDARDKNNINYVYEVDVKVKKESEILVKNKSNDILKTPDETYVFPKGKIKPVIIIGAGPAGLFAAYLLAQNGFKPLIIERGEKVENRIKSVNEFWETGKLNKNSNVQFGEGGAGTFSDGKLNTLVKDKKFLMKKVFEIFVENGAPEEILYLNKPHIGTDKLRQVVKNMREKIIQNGGTFRYNTCLTNIILENNKLKQIEVNNNQLIDCENLILAIGHSARDTFEMLYEKNIKMISKPFAVGIRISHPQKLINISQYGESYKKLSPASYKLTYNTKSGRGVYSFCMCPGGYVVNASSEDGYLAVNGMSNYKRESENANSAIVVTVSPKDFGEHPLSGIKFQRNLEKLAYQQGKGNIPIQLYKDFKEGKISNCFGNINPIFKGGYTFADINEILPDYICESLKEGIDNFDKKIKDFGSDDVIIAGVESRTSSPVRIERDEYFSSNIEGIYPAGEGAGYAGGITTSAMDGIKVAEAISLK